MTRFNVVANLYRAVARGELTRAEAEEIMLRPPLTLRRLLLWRAGLFVHSLLARVLL